MLFETIETIRSYRELRREENYLIYSKFGSKPFSVTYKLNNFVN